MLIPVILSGGSGSRLWPLSRLLRPKQFLGVTEDASLFQLTLQRLQGIMDLPRFHGHRWTLGFRPRLFRALR